MEGAFKRVTVSAIHPRIVLERCAYCVAGRVRYVANGRVVDQECAHCRGHGTLTTESA